MHYAASVHLFSSLDRFNTKLPERLHIDYAKKAYRASNKWNYVTQMTTWLRQQDSMFLMELYLSWSRSLPSECPIPPSQSPPLFTELGDRGSDQEDSSEQVDEMVRRPNEALDTSLFTQRLDNFVMLSRTCGYHLPRSCPLSGVHISLMQENHHAPLLSQALEQYIRGLHPQLCTTQIWPVKQRNVYKSISLLTPPHKHISATKRIFKLHASITYPTTPMTFNTALIIEDPGLYHGMGMTGDCCFGS